MLPGWFEGADELFATMLTDVPWRAEQRPMYDNVVDVPRLLHHYGVGDPLPHPALVEAREALTAHYADELGEPFVTAGCCYYRDGRDSVAWHGDNIGRGRSHDTMVAIVSFGSRQLKLRPRPVGGHTEAAYPLGHGDLIVMGGSCQRTWEHAIPKTSRPVGPAGERAVPPAQRAAEGLFQAAPRSGHDEGPRRSGGLRGGSVNGGLRSPCRPCRRTGLRHPWRRPSPACRPRPPRW